MKLKLGFNNNQTEIDANVEKLIEKGMEQHERTWKDKFTFKHNAKKEMIDIKHKNKLEVEEKRRKTRYQIKQEEIRKNKEQEFRHILIGLAIMFGVILFFIILAILGSKFGW